jgi:hypothetical protein
MNFDIIPIWFLGIALGLTIQRWRVRNLRAELRNEYRIADDLRSFISGTKPWLSGWGADGAAVSATADEGPLPASSVLDANGEGQPDD